MGKLILAVRWFGEGKLLKYMRLTIGQLKCASDFVKQITSARWKLSHETHLAAEPTRL